jgi:multidrug efflux pump subunit AcrA (membrane-fusion protein)
MYAPQHLESIVESKRHALRAVLGNLRPPLLTSPRRTFETDQAAQERLVQKQAARQIELDERIRTLQSLLAHPTAALAAKREEAAAGSRMRKQKLESIDADIAQLQRELEQRVAQHERSIAAARAGLEARKARSATDMERLRAQRHALFVAHADLEHQRATCVDYYTQSPWHRAPSFCAVFVQLCQWACLTRAVPTCACARAHCCCGEISAVGSGGCEDTTTLHLDAAAAQRSMEILRQVDVHYKVCEHIYYNR